MILAPMEHHGVLGDHLAALDAVGIVEKIEVHEAVHLAIRATRPAGIKAASTICTHKTLGMIARALALGLDVLKRRVSHQQT